MSWNKLTTEQWIEKARAVHGQRYDYSQTVYGGADKKLTIVCPEHGPFEQVASTHTNGRAGCLACAIFATSRAQALTTEQWIEKARAVHGSKYDYSQVVYFQAHGKITIICPEHGSFEQAANSHLQGTSCPFCVGKGIPTTEQWIEKARAVHSGKYDYSETVYVYALNKITIICPEHGPFEQVANKHLHGSGCRACHLLKAGDAQALTTGQWIEKARAVHGQRYDYSQTVYTRSVAKLTIICPEHGSFEQGASGHINAGSGCQSCAIEQARKHWIERATGKIALLYFVRVYRGGEEFYKVGVTANSLGKRFTTTKLAGYQYEILALHKSTNAAAVWDWEQSILETFAHLRYHPKRRFEGATECFSSCEEILSIFPL